MTQPADKPPNEKPTVALDKPPPWAIALTERVVQGFANTEARFDRTDANIEVVSNDLKVTKDRVTILEQSRALTSDRVKSVSQENLDQNAAIAHVITKIDALDAKVESKTAEQTAQLLARFDSALKNPVVKMIGSAILAAVATWLASKGINVK